MGRRMRNNDVGLASPPFAFALFCAEVANAYGDRNGRGALSDSDGNGCLFAMYFVPRDSAPLL